MKFNMKTRVICGLVTAAMLTVTLGTTAVYADDPNQVLMDIQKSIDEAVEYSIEHPEQTGQKPAEDPWCGYGYPYYWWDHCHVREPWYYSGPSDIVLEIGDTYQINVPGGRGDFQSTNGGVASVNGYGVVTGVGEGNCVIRVIGYQGGLAYIRVRVNGRPKNNNNNNNTTVVYVQQPVNNTPTINASWLAIATNMVVAAPKNGTVNLGSGSPLYLDTSFANVLKLRPDVTVNITYGFNGHTFLLTIPKNYNLARRLNAAGYVDFVTLSNVVDGRIMCRLLY